MRNSSTIPSFEEVYALKVDDNNCVFALQLHDSVCAYKHSASTLSRLTKTKRLILREQTSLQVCKLYTDIAIGNAEASFACAAKPLAALSGVSVSGSIMTGRQITAPPEQPMRSFAVGKWRSVAIPVTIKGSRALLKVYTDVKVEADEPKVWYNMGLEPTVALVILLSHVCLSDAKTKFPALKR